MFSYTNNANCNRLLHQDGCYLQTVTMRGMVCPSVGKGLPPTASLPPSGTTVGSASLDDGALLAERTGLAHFYASLGIIRNGR